MKTKEPKVAAETKSAMSIRKCVCKQLFQDQRYGGNQRIHNHMKNGKWRCTGCGSVKD